jgi:hypothetical protein
MNCPPTRKSEKLFILDRQRALFRLVKIEGSEMAIKIRNLGIFVLLFRINSHRCEKSFDCRGKTPFRLLGPTQLNQTRIYE